MFILKAYSCYILIYYGDSTGDGQSDRERDRESQADFALSTEPDEGLDPTAL